MNYIVLRPTGAMLVVSINAFSCIYYIFVNDKWQCTTHYGNAGNFVQAFTEMAKEPVIITDITTIDELTYLYPELFV